MGNEVMPCQAADSFTSLTIWHLNDTYRHTKRQRPGNNTDTIAKTLWWLQPQHMVDPQHNIMSSTVVYHSRILPS